MRCKIKVLVGILIVVIALVSLVSADWEFNGTIYDVNGNALNNSNVTMLIRNQSWAQVWYNSTTSNATGRFGIVLPNNTGYMYQLSIRHDNANGYADYVGQSLPSFPYGEFSQLSNVDFYLKSGGTMNITVINRSGDQVPNNEFAYQVKDTRLGYEISACSNTGSYDVICYVQRDRNYSIMIYPSQGSSQQFVPVSFDWRNFTDSTSYYIDSANLSSYNGTTKTLNKMFNATESFAKITGYINNSGVDGWEELTIVPILLEPGNMVFMDYGTLPYNASAWDNGQSDFYNLTTGFYNITVPYSLSETVNYLLFATAKNSSFYGSYKNISVSGDTEINFTMYGLLGNSDVINMTEGGGGGNYIVNTSKRSFSLVNASNTSQTLSQMSAHIELIVDYSDYGCMEFTFMEDISQQGSAEFSLPLLSVTGLKEINIYTQNYAPKRIGTKTASQISGGLNISMSAFDPGEIPGETAIASGRLSVAMYHSNSSCDVPSPLSGCILLSSSNLSTINPLNFVIGGGDLSFRVGLGGVLVHYANVDFLASGPPDALFEDNDEVTESTSSSFSKAMRFGSNGPTIYDYVLVSIPYTQGSSSTTGLNESAQVNLSLSRLYDESWNTIWNTAGNGTNATNLAGNYSHYTERQSEWQTLLSGDACTTSTASFGVGNPCYIDASANRIWVRLPHFSGTQTSISGNVITANDTDDDDDDSSSTTTATTTSYWTSTYVANGDDFINETGYTKTLSAKQRLRVTINSVSHYIGIISLTSSTATINISSDPQQAVFSKDEEKKFDVIGDGYYDILVKLNEISSSQANITIKSIHEKMPEEEQEATSSSENETTGSTKKEAQTEEDKGGQLKEGGKISLLYWILIGVIIILIIGIALFWYYYFYKKLIKGQQSPLLKKQGKKPVKVKQMSVPKKTVLKKSVLNKSIPNNSEPKASRNPIFNIFKIFKRSK